MQLLNTINTNCCTLTFSVYQYKNYFCRNKPKRKAGIIILDRICSKILLVQSNGNKWGVPKGSIEQDETVEDCAIRELFEETGLMIRQSQLEKFIQIYSRTYYIIEHSVISTSSGSDATGIGWICIECLRELVNSNKMQITKDCEMIVQKLYADKYYGERRRGGNSLYV